MRLVEIMEGSVWSVQYPGDKDDIFALLLDRWQDPEYIQDYIYKCAHLIEANPFWKNCSYQKVMLSAINEAKNLESYFVQLLLQQRERNSSNTRREIHLIGQRTTSR